jgi:outer membrane protein TolC
VKLIRILLNALLAAVAVLVSVQRTSAQSSTNLLATTNNTAVVDLPTVLKLAGGRALDIQIAREKLAEAKANHESSLWQFFPTISPGFGYRRHDNLIQNVEGAFLDVHKDSYTIGPVIAAQIDLGDAIYKRLAARQLMKAAESALDAQRQDTDFAAVLGFFDLLKTQAAVAVAEDSVRISTDFSRQLQLGLDAGITFKGDLLRAHSQIEKNALSLRQAQEQQRIASARLIQLLRLDPNLQLSARDTDLIPLALVATNTTLDSLFIQAMAARPEIQQSRMVSEAARSVRKGAVYGPLIPSVGAQVFAGGLGGSSESAPSRFGHSEDYQFTLSWKIGPGGLFDRSRARAAEARLNIADLNGQKVVDEINRQVTESFVRYQSFGDQLTTARRGVQAAEQALEVTRQRKELAVGVALENIQSEQDLTRARLDFVNAVAEYNKAQYSLLKATGAMSADSSAGSTGSAGPSVDTPR